MKRSILGWVLVAGSAATAWAGDATNAPSGEANAGLLCPKCEAVWVGAPHQTGRVTVYRPHKAMRCPDCDSALANLVKTGKFAHTCKLCGDAEACRAVQKELKQDAGNEAAAKTAESAVACNKCKTVWIRKTVWGNKGLTVRSEKAVVCAECDATAERCLRGGKPGGACKGCGGTITACESGG